MNELFHLQEHAYHLCKVTNQLGNPQNDNWSLASDWLHLGSSIESINVITESYDDNIMYCGPSIEYENAKSKVLEKFTKELSVFNFFWGAFETIVKIIDPPKVPNNLKKRRNSIDDCVFFLKNEYPIIKSPKKYNEEQSMQKLRIQLSKTKSVKEAECRKKT